MRTIKEASKEYTNNSLLTKALSNVNYEENNYEAGYNDSLVNNTGEAFRAGVEFAQRWISIEDELPTEEGKYLVKMTDDYMKIVSWDIGKYESCWSCNPKYITHWRPVEIK